MQCSVLDAEEAAKRKKMNPWFQRAHNLMER